ncbi:uncharacterized protein MYCFIDRAFT_169050 [Pseudocercospora fijiensis CIRAD86]|uniref:Uncharacterized protein n=1 Tax=Pseudocercospora fijiensis (strain CIRAD86) TaxID=383855 RepID=N1Q6W6_PSEFD|nr:uncharacterized protein MYCFIDRAFT_169050 [Pseudocercospora fijiensis CIRAD86]EME87191.1 hypothetical protein MYCFIDRAFT_169050 [Pseudocercospora fijiensis CIRAD86]
MLALTYYLTEPQHSGKAFWKQQAFPNRAGRRLGAKPIVNFQNFTLQLFSPRRRYKLLSDDIEYTGSKGLGVLGNTLASSEIWTETGFLVHVNPLAGRGNCPPSIVVSWASVTEKDTSGYGGGGREKAEAGPEDHWQCKRIGAEFKSRDPLGVGKRVAAPARRGLTASDFSDDVLRSSSSAAKVECFRSVVEAELSSVEQDFRNFMSGQNFQSFESTQWPSQNLEEIGFKHRKLSRQTRKGVDGPVNRESDADIEHPEPVWERSSQGEVVYQEDGRPEWKWRHEWRKLRKQHQEQNHHLLEQRTAKPWEKHASEQMDDFDLHQSVALARLRQIRRHLVIPENQQRDLPTWKEDWEKHLERCDFSIDREMDNYSPPLEEAHRPLEQEHYYFHCPYRECHHRLLRQNENLSLAFRHRVCVHDGCGYVSQTVDEWLKHKALPSTVPRRGIMAILVELLLLLQYSTAITAKSFPLSCPGSRLEIQTAPAPASRQEFGGLMMMMGDGLRKNYVRWSTEMDVDEERGMIGFCLLRRVLYPLLCMSTDVVEMDADKARTPFCRTMARSLLSDAQPALDDGVLDQLDEYVSDRCGRAYFVHCHLAQINGATEYLSPFTDCVKEDYLLPGQTLAAIVKTNEIEEELQVGTSHLRRSKHEGLKSLACASLLDKSYLDPNFAYNSSYFFEQLFSVSPDFSNRFESSTVFDMGMHCSVVLSRDQTRDRII